MRPPATTFSPLTIAALLASLAAHASVAMYMADPPAGSSSNLAAVDTATTMDIETVALPAPEEPKPDVLRAVEPNVVPAVTAPRAAPVTKPAETVPTPDPVTPAAAAPAVVGTSGDDSPHFAMVVGAGATAPGGVTRAGGSGAAAGASSAEAPGASDAPLPASGVDEIARLESGPAPSYPSAAKDEGVEADVPLDIVVDEAGRVIDVRATRHLGYGLDESAAKAIRGYRFSPAKRGGRAVKVRMRWTVVFRLS